MTIKLWFLAETPNVTSVKQLWNNETWAHDLPYSGPLDHQYTYAYHINEGRNWMHLNTHWNTLSNKCDGFYALNHTVYFQWILMCKHQNDQFSPENVLCGRFQKCQNIFLDEKWNLQDPISVKCYPQTWGILEMVGIFAHFIDPNRLWTHSRNGKLLPMRILWNILLINKGNKFLSYWYIWPQDTHYFTYSTDVRSHMQWQIQDFP